jgi:predicted nuclease of restriction endonuclease-like (RecB) superfamily
MMEPNTTGASAAIDSALEKSFGEVAEMIRTAQQRTFTMIRSCPELMEELGWPERFKGTLWERLVQHVQSLLMRFDGFCFVGSEYPLQVGGRDFALDLLFFHRGLNCLVAVELKVGRFEPEYLGKLNFYLEALDRDERKPHEKPAIGVLLCASKDDEVVEYALNRSLSPALIAEYQTQLPDKALLQAKLHEFYILNALGGDDK